MKNLQTILPVVAIFVALGAAIYHVQANTPERPAPVEVSKAVSAPSNTAPLSDRYASHQ